MNTQIVNNKNAGTILGTEVILKGTEGEPTSEDMDFIGKALVASYNNVHWEVGHYMTGEHAVDFMGPDGILCNHCPDDDAMGGIESLLMTAVTEDCAGLCKKDAAAELEVNFCNKIRSAQGSKYLNSAKSCAIKFDTQADNDNNPKHVASNASNNVATIDSTLILKGVA